MTKTNDQARSDQSGEATAGLRDGDRGVSHAELVTVAAKWLKRQGCNVVLGDCAELDTNPRNPLGLKGQGGVLSVGPALLLAGLVAVVFLNQKTVGARLVGAFTSECVGFPEHVFVSDCPRIAESGLALGNGTESLKTQAIPQRRKSRANRSASAEDGYRGLTVFKFVSLGHPLPDSDHNVVRPSAPVVSQGDLHDGVSRDWGRSRKANFVDQHVGAFAESQRSISRFGRAFGQLKAEVRVVEKNGGGKDSDKREEGLYASVVGLRSCGFRLGLTVGIFRLASALLLLGICSAGLFVLALRRNRRVLAAGVVGAGLVGTLIARAWALSAGCL